MRAVIMAGGRGTRLAPFTNVLPKPLIPIGDYPILEIIICQLRKAGFTDITLALGYLSHLFMAYFGDGQRLGVNINYSLEDIPLGTAGPLALIDDLYEPFLLMNGDLLTSLNYTDLYDFHVANSADITMSLHTKEVKIDFGVVAIDKASRITEITEKPSYTYLVNMGIYVISPRVIEHIPYNQFYLFTDLIEKVRAEEGRVYGYPFHGDWFDLGRVEDLTSATENYLYLTEVAAERVPLEDYVMLSSVEQSRNE